MQNLKKNSLIRFAIFALALILAAGAISVLKSPTTSILSIPLEVFNFIKNETAGVIFYHRNMVERQRLANELMLFKKKANDANEALIENNRLKKILLFKQNSAFRVLAARVIACSPDNWSQAVIIDKGVSSGIKKGYIAINYLGLIGRVVEVSGVASKILLISDPGLGVSGIVQRNRQEGLVTGTLSTNLIMRYLPKGADIAAADVIVTSGLTANFPKGLIIGTVLIVILAVCQATFLNGFRFLGLRPDLLLICAIISGLIFNFDLKWLIAGSILSGALKDILTVNYFGLNIILFVLIALGVARLSKEITLDSTPVQTALTLCVCLLYNIVYIIISAYLGIFISLGMILRVTLAGSVYTALFFPVIYIVVSGLGFDKADI
ncbi:MAG: rod shape-determining protein MreC [Candidatus Omnitrophica bacterium]|nr:rod shape-determining protein MreC [Candidatus Omnitrophota bacterium]